MIMNIKRTRASVLGAILTVALPLSVFFAGCDDNDKKAVDTTVPTVSYTNPADAATGVFINQKIAVTFSEAMDPLTITATTFTLTQGATPVPGAVTFSGSLGTFAPTSNLTPSTEYTATITTGAADLAGNPLAANKAWTFTTGTTADTTAPIVVSTNPSDAATDVFRNRKITATFSEAMDPLTITGTTFTLMQGATSVPGVVTYFGSVASFSPTGRLAASTAYTATITTGVADLAGNPLAANRVWVFTTGATTDTTRPTVSYTNPADAATGVRINRNIVATFSETMDPLTITGTTFTLIQGTTPVPGAVTVLGSVATFAPSSNLAAGTEYTARITNLAADLAGNKLAASKVWTFTTGTAVAAGPQPVLLGTTSGFAILTKAGVTDVPTSIITGNVGASPITGDAIHLTCAEVTGTIYSVDAAGPLPCRVTDAPLLTTAVSDMELAYTDAAGRTEPAPVTELGAGNIGGLDLAPGLYKWSTGVNIPTDVTLTGGADDVWIFQIAEGLTLANATTIHLGDSAQAKNVFWQAFGVVAIGTTAHFEGTILAKTEITVGTGAVVNGRLLAQTAVTLDSNTVTAP
jgi:hypothetical protein